MLLGSEAAVKARIISVHDGDTFTATWKGKTYHCRLNNFDAPELKQNFGIDAWHKLEELVTGSIVTIDSVTHDRYGRVVTNVWINGLRLDSIMIREGYAWHYVAYNSETMLAQCQEDAMSEKLGLWSYGTKAACPPWLFRKYNNRNKTRYCSGCPTPL